MGRVIRERKVIPLRHPLKQLVVVVEGSALGSGNSDADVTNSIERVRSYIFEELNVKELKMTTQRSEYGIEMKAKPNFPVLAVKAKDKMKELGPKIEKMTDVDVQKLRDSGVYVIDGYELNTDDIKILPKIDAAKFSQFDTDFDENVIFRIFFIYFGGLKKFNMGNFKVIVLLDVTPDEEMLNEGVVRDILNRIQRLRKELKIVPTDNIDVYYQCEPNESKLGALVKKSAENIESNIKKPFKPYEKGLALNVTPKSFEVNI